VIRLEVSSHVSVGGHHHALSTTAAIKQTEELVWNQDPPCFLFYYTPQKY